MTQKVISVSMDQDLADAVDELAYQNRQNRSEFIRALIRDNVDVEKIEVAT